MARGIRQNEVDAAADALVAAGERPTVDRIRAHLGTGSPNTIQRMLEHWWSELAPRLNAVATVAVPEAPESVQRAMGAVWSQAVAVARTDAAEALAPREARVAAREADLTAASEAADQRWQREVDRARALEAIVATLRSELAQERARSTEASGALSVAVASHRELQNQVQQLLATAERRETQYRRDLERADAQEKRWLRELDTARQAHKAAESRCRELSRSLEQEKRRSDLRLEGQRRKKTSARMSSNVAVLEQSKAASAAARPRKAAPSAPADKHPAQPSRRRKATSLKARVARSNVSAVRAAGGSLRDAPTAGREVLATKPRRRAPSPARPTQGSPSSRRKRAAR